MTDTHHQTYASRLQTFSDHWTQNSATARQLAAIGHVYDRPPLEALEEGTRCISCTAFVQRDLSVAALESPSAGARTYEEGFRTFDFHHPSCTRLQVRIPLEPQAVLPGLYGGGTWDRVSELKRRFERVGPSTSSGGHSTTTTTTTARVCQRSSLFSLPAEIRLQIYALVLPHLDAETDICTLHRDSSRTITRQGLTKAGPRSTTKCNILRTCRAVHDEATDLLYTKTVFKFDSTKVMYLFLRGIGKSGRALLKAVDIHCGGREDALGFALLATCDSLKTITIRLPRPRILFSRAPIWVVDGVACLLALRGLERVTFAGGVAGSPLRFLSDEGADAVAVREELMERRGGLEARSGLMERYLAGDV